MLRERAVKWETILVPALFMKNILKNKIGEIEKLSDSGRKQAAMKGYKKRG